jgi:hypothetical protein
VNSHRCGAGGSGSQPGRRPSWPTATDDQCRRTWLADREYLGKLGQMGAMRCCGYNGGDADHNLCTILIYGSQRISRDTRIPQLLLQDSNNNFPYIFVFWFACNKNLSPDSHLNMVILHSSTKYESNSYSLAFVCVPVVFQ